MGELCLLKLSIQISMHAGLQPPSQGSLWDPAWRDIPWDVSRIPGWSWNPGACHLPSLPVLPVSLHRSRVSVKLLLCEFLRSAASGVLFSVESGHGWMWENTQGYFLVEFCSQSSQWIYDMGPISSSNSTILALILIFFPVLLSWFLFIFFNQAEFLYKIVNFKEKLIFLISIWVLAELLKEAWTVWRNCGDCGRVGTAKEKDVLQSTTVL